MKNEKQFMLRLDSKVLIRIKKQSDRFGATPSSYIRLAIIEKLEKDESNGKKAGR